MVCLLWFGQRMDAAPTQFVWLLIAKTKRVDATLIGNIENIMPQLASIYYPTNVVF